LEDRCTQRRFGAQKFDGRGPENELFERSSLVKFFGNMPWIKLLDIPKRVAFANAVENQSGS
jgi:hypothetical protein